MPAVSRRYAWSWALDDDTLVAHQLQLQRYDLPFTVPMDGEANGSVLNPARKQKLTRAVGKVQGDEKAFLLADALKEKDLLRAGRDRKPVASLQGGRPAPQVQEPPTQRQQGIWVVDLPLDAAPGAPSQPEARTPSGRRLKSLPTARPSTAWACGTPLGS